MWRCKTYYLILRVKMIIELYDKGESMTTTEEVQLREEDIQLAENINTDYVDEASAEEIYKIKREELNRTKIAKQTWSVREIINKIKSGFLDLDPDYQRNVVWPIEKKVAFIESLLMGIVVPPLYFVEVPGDGPLEPTKYEVVDGKQRLNSIATFVNNNLKLLKKHLEYFGDIYSDQTFTELSAVYPDEMEEFASQTLDIYVITASSPDFTKYDIFSRLNKGSDPLRVNEIRKAVYHSELIDIVEQFVTYQLEHNQEVYKKLFSNARIKRYEDYGIFYKAIAFYVSTNETEYKIDGYNSRPRELINNVLSSFQKPTGIKQSNRSIEDYPIEAILEKTINILEYFDDTSNAPYYLECCIKLAVDNEDKFIEKREKIKEDEEILSTFIKSKATTTNVDKRVERVYSIIC